MQSTQKSILDSRPWPQGDQMPYFSYLYEGYRIIIKAPCPRTGSNQVTTLFHHTGKLILPIASPVLLRMSKGCCHPQHLAASTSLGCLSQAIPSKALNKHKASP